MTLARLQQVLTIGAVGLATLWIVVCLALGRPGWAAAGAAVLLFGHAGVLAFEMLLARHAQPLNGSAHPTPTPGVLDWTRAWAAEATIAVRVFCWQQPFRSRRWPDHLPAGAHGRRGVLLIHGFVCNRGLWNRWMERLTASGIPFVAVDLEPVFGPIDAHVARIEAAVQALERATGLAPVAVAHSMGGLALRRWWVEARDDTRLHRAISLGTPHHGTWLARWAFSENGRQMRIGSGWVGTLRDGEGSTRARRFTCFVGRCDNIVFPPSCAVLDGAEVKVLPAVAHVQLVFRDEPWQELLRWLERRG